MKTINTIVCFLTLKHPNIFKVLRFVLLYSNFKGEATRESALTFDVLP